MTIHDFMDFNGNLVTRHRNALHDSRIVKMINNDLQRPVKLDHWIWVVCLRVSNHKSSEVLSETSRKFALNLFNDFQEIAEDSFWLSKWTDFNIQLANNIKQNASYLSNIDRMKWSNSVTLYKKLLKKSIKYKWDQRIIKALSEVCDACKIW
jgi:hypothetical protein